MSGEEETKLISIQGHGTKKLITQKFRTTDETELGESDSVEIDSKRQKVEYLNTTPSFEVGTFTQHKSPDNNHSQKQIRKQTPISFEFDIEKDYKKEYHRIYLANIAIMDKISRLTEENRNIKAKISTFKSEKTSRQRTDEQKDDSDSNETGSEDFSLGRRRKKRRRKEEIERVYSCSAKECGRSYG